MMNSVISRFDGARAWTALDAETQARIGAIALELAVASLDYESVPDSGLSAADRAVESAVGVLDAMLIDVAGEILGPPARPPRVPSLLGPVCNVCGCSHYDPCAAGCGWAGPCLCTACAAGGPEAAA